MRPASPLSNTLASFTIPLVLPELQLSNLDVVVEQNNTQTKISGASLVIAKGSPQGHAVLVEAAEISHNDGTTTRHIAPLALSLALAPGELLIQTLSANHLELLQDSRLQLASESQGQSLLTANLNHPGGTTALSLTVEGNTLAAIVTTALTDITALAELSRPGNLAGQTLSGAEAPGFIQGTEGAIHMDATVHVDLDRPSDASAALNILAGQLVLSGIPLEECRISALLADGQIGLSNASCRSGATNIKAAAQGIQLDLLREQEWQKLLASTEITLHFDSPELEKFEPWLKHVRAAHLFENSVQLALEGAVKNGTVSVPHASLLLDRNRITIERALFDIPQDLTTWAEQPLDIQAEAEITDLALIAELLNMPAVSGQLSAMAELNGSFNQLQGHVFVKGRDLQHGGIPIGRLDSEIFATTGQLRFDTLTIDNNFDRLTAHGSLDLTEKQIGELAVSATIQDISRYLPQKEQDAATIKGGLNLQLTAAGPFTAPQISVTLNGPDMAIHETLPCDLDMEARYNGSTLIIQKASFISEQGSVSLTGEISPDPSRKSGALLLNSLAFADRDGQGFALMDPFTILFDHSGLVFADGMILQNGTAEIAISGDWQRDGQGMTVKTSALSSEALPLFIREQMEWFSFKGAEITGHLRRQEQISLDLKGHVAALGSQKYHSFLTGDLDISLVDRVLHVKQWDWRQGDLLVIALTGTWSLADQKNRKTDDIHFDAVLDAPEADLLRPFFLGYVGGSEPVKARINLRGSLKNPSGSIEIETGQIDIHAAPHAPPDLSPAITASLHGRASTDRNTIKLETFTFASDLLDITASATLTDIDWRQYLTGEKTIPQGSIAADVSLVLREHVFFAEQFKPLEHLRGSLEATLQVSGSSTAPIFKITGGLIEGEYRASPEMQAMREIDFLLAGSSEQITIDHFSGTLGGAPFSLHGALHATDWRNPDINLQLTGDNLLLYRDDGVKLRADMQLDITGPLSSTQLSGSVSLTEAVYSKQVDMLTLFQEKPKRAGKPGLELFSFKERPFNTMKLSVEIDSLTPVVVANNLVKGGLRPELTLTGTGEVPIVVGDIYIDSSRIAMPAGRIVVDNGIIRFLPGDPDRPLMDIGATAKMSGYEISIQISGPVDEPVVTLSSVPPLPEEDLLLLILTGRLPAGNVSGTFMMQTGASVAVYLGKNILATLFANGEDVTEESILDRFELDIGRGITQTGDNTIEARFLLTEDLLTSNSALYLVTEKDIYDDFNGGVRLVFRFK